MKKVLITGVNGFTGIYLADLLATQGWQVHGIGQDLAVPDMPHYRGVDMLDREALASAVADIRPNAVVHLAGISATTHQDVDALYRVNLMTTRHLLQALAATPLSLDLVVLPSSAYVYGSMTEGVLSESSELSPGNDYAVSKLAMEYMARLWMKRLPIVIVRPFNYTGIGQSEDFLIPKIVAHFERREPVIELGNVDVRREFNDVRDIALAYSRLLDAQPVGQTINVCSGKAIAIADVLALAEQITGHQIKVQVNPAYVRPGDVKLLCGDPSRLCEWIGDWTPRPMRDTLTWMLQGAARGH